MIDETLFGGFPSREVKADIYNGVSETRAVSPPLPPPPPRGFDINVTWRSFEFMNHFRFHKAQLGTAGLFFGHVQLEGDTNARLFLPRRETRNVPSCFRRIGKLLSDPFRLTNELNLDFIVARCLRITTFIDTCYMHFL